MSVGCLSYTTLINPQINLFKTKANLLHIRNQSAQRSKHFPPRSWKPVFKWYTKQRSLSVLRPVQNT